MRQFWSKLKRALQRRSLDSDLDAELRSHLDLIVEDNVARGMTPEQARTAALRRVGNPTAARERALEAWRFRPEGFFQDVRHSFRGIRKAPSLWLVVILSLALGIGLAQVAPVIAGQPSAQRQQPGADRHEMRRIEPVQQCPGQRQQRKTADTARALLIGTRMELLERQAEEESKSQE